MAMTTMNCGIKHPHLHEVVYCDICGAEIGMYCEEVHMKAYTRGKGDHYHIPREPVTRKVR